MLWSLTVAGGLWGAETGGGRWKATEPHGLRVFFLKKKKQNGFTQAVTVRGGDSLLINLTAIDIP